MNKIQQRMGKLIQRIIDSVMGNGLMQEENTAEGEAYENPGCKELLRQCATEGIVLLKNDGVLPLRKADELAVFGRCQHDWFYVGYGSGGDVHPPYKAELFPALEKYGVNYNKGLEKEYKEWSSTEENKVDHGWWGHWPYFYPELPLNETAVKRAASESSVALVIIGRAAGEDRENTLEKGSYYLTDLERQMLDLVTKTFSKTILLMDCGNIIDMSFVSEYKFSAILYAWQLGQESGNAIAEILSGAKSPSGRLSASIAREYSLYPSSSNFGNPDYNQYKEGIFVGYRHFCSKAPGDVLFPFGYGLTYTNFNYELVNSNVDINKKVLSLDIKVKNNGDYISKDVVQIYCQAPEGRLEKEKRRLIAFQKTHELSPQEETILTFRIDFENLASYDDSGITGHKDCFILESGNYIIYSYGDSLSSKEIFNFELPELYVTQKCAALLNSKNLRERIIKNLPEELPASKNKNINLREVKEGKYTLEEFVATLSDRELADLTRGEGGMNSPLGCPGNAGAFGGITAELRKKGVKPVITADGPAGLRIKKLTSLLPCGTAIACTFNTELVKKMFFKIGQEVRHFKIDVILSPGMNIQRNPLCGRNFEYYSEDPLLSGKIASAAVLGIQQVGVSACPKHFACNNQEVNRNRNDSIVDLRTLREIYLRNFEICVKESKPKNIMTSYNKINGVWSHYNYDLVTSVLRGEWKYEGNVITDWWMRKAQCPEFPKLKDNAYRVRAGVDVLMPGNMSYTKRKYTYDREQLKSLGKKDGLTKAELQRTAINVLRFVLDTM